jgi:hypothetical protein
MPPHLIFSYARREGDQGDKKHKERVEVRGHPHSRVKGRGARVQRQGRRKGNKTKKKDRGTSLRSFAFSEA